MLDLAERSVSRSMRRLALILTCLAVAGCGVHQPLTSGDRPHTRSTPSFAANQRLARAFARRALASVRLPVGSRRVRTDPAPGTLAHPQSQPGAEHAVDRPRFWRVPGTPGELLAWLRRHTPHGTYLTLSGAGGQRGVTYVWTRGYSYRVLPSEIYQAELDLAVAAASGGGTAVRVDAYAAGLVPRPQWERVPPAVTSVSISAWSVNGRHSYPLASVTNSARVAWLIRLVDETQIVQPGGFIGCPLIAPAEPLLRLRFRSASGATLAQAAEVPCGGLKFAVGGRSGPPLGLNADLTGLLWARHVLATCSSISVKPEPLAHTPRPVLFTLPFEIRDSSASACGLRGYPQVRLHLLAGSWVTPREARIPAGHPVTPAPVLLDSGWPAQTSISWPDPKCKAQAFNRAQLRLPGVPTPLTVRLRGTVAPCGDRITVAPLS
jgi:hypothetical protein